jgi:hypothetical protein
MRRGSSVRAFPVGFGLAFFVTDTLREVRVDFKASVPEGRVYPAALSLCSMSLALPKNPSFE